MLCRYPDCAEILDCSIVVPAEEFQVGELSVSEIFSTNIPFTARRRRKRFAESLFRRTGSVLCLSVTGNAGPDYCDGVEPGTFCISLLYDGKMTTRRYVKSFRERNLAIEFMARSALNSCG